MHRDDEHLHPLDREYLELLDEVHRRHPELVVLFVPAGRRGRSNRNAAVRRAIEGLEQ